jgi:hypothetical protein
MILRQIVVILSFVHFDSWMFLSVITKALRFSICFKQSITCNLHTNMKKIFTKKLFIMKMIVKNQWILTCNSLTNAYILIQEWRSLWSSFRITILNFFAHLLTYFFLSFFLNLFSTIVLTIRLAKMSYVDKTIVLNVILLLMSKMLINFWNQWISFWKFFFMIKKLIHDFAFRDFDFSSWATINLKSKKWFFIAFIHWQSITSLKARIKMSRYMSSNWQWTIM